MQKIARQRRHHDFSEAHLFHRTVKRVAGDRMLQRGEVHANLVCAPGVELDFQQRRVADSRENAPIGASFPGIGNRSAVPGFALHRHARAADGIGPPPVAAARSWLARIGWQRHGLLGLDERPKGGGSG